MITLDNRGIPPTSECPDGFTLQDMVGDVAGLIEHLGIGPCRVVGTSLGAFITQELALSRPDLVRRAVLIATRAAPICCAPRSRVPRSSCTTPEWNSRPGTPPWCGP
ncbi:hypothetical protein GCM10017744_009340 [Streptomyces antimycoticus]